jgi:hypothetical protein
MTQSLTRSKSIGVLREAKTKTKPKSPDLIGELRLQRHTSDDIAAKFQATDKDELTCGIAGWGYSEDGKLYITVELSPPYEPAKRRRPDILSAMFGDEK